DLSSQLIQQKREHENRLEELEKSKDQRIKELEEGIKELEEALELEEETSDCHLEALEVARQWRIRQSKEKDDNLEKASRKIETLENIVA
ncbi:11895_t:CDS:1, partial [Ambispora gerdemannii]